ncbi:MAG: hypothetical protein ACLUSL_12540 [Ruminococcus sp.]
MPTTAPVPRSPQPLLPQAVQPPRHPKTCGAECCHEREHLPATCRTALVLTGEGRQIPGRAQRLFGRQAEVQGQRGVVRWAMSFCR